MFAYYRKVRRTFLQRQQNVQTHSVTLRFPNMLACFVALNLAHSASFKQIRVYLPNGLFSYRTHFSIRK